MTTLLRKPNITITKPVNYHFVEKELKQAIPYLIRWDKKQNNIDDVKTDFIYKVDTFKELTERLQYIRNTLHKQLNIGYALNRWVNFHSSKTVEKMFSAYDCVRAEPNEKHPTIDVHMKDPRDTNKKKEISFDIKLSVFPDRLLKDGKTPNDYRGRKGKNELIKWMYENQSTDRRFHTDNRFFVVVHSRNAKNNYETKLQFDIIADKIQKYMEHIYENPEHNINEISFVIENKKIKKNEFISVFSDLIMIEL